MLNGLHFVVTGGTGALGSAVVRQIIGHGGYCHVPCVDARELDRFDLADHPRVRVTMGGELRDERTVAAFYGSIASLWGSIHCAGGFAMSPFTDTPLAVFLELFDTNAVSCFLSCREAVKAMRRNSGPEVAAMAHAAGTGPAATPESAGGGGETTRIARAQRHGILRAARALTSTAGLRFSRPRPRRSVPGAGRS